MKKSKKKEGGVIFLNYEGKLPEELDSSIQNKLFELENLRKSLSKDVDFQASGLFLDDETDIRQTTEHQGRKTKSSLSQYRQIMKSKKTED